MKQETEQQNQPPFSIKDCYAKPWTRTTNLKDWIAGVCVRFKDIPTEPDKETAIFFRYNKYIYHIDVTKEATNRHDLLVRFRKLDFPKLKKIVEDVSGFEVTKEYLESA